MPVIETIGAVLSSAKTLGEIIKRISNSDVRSELNGKVIELQSGLIKAQQEMLELLHKHEEVLREYKQLKEAAGPRQKPKMKWGCYEFEGEEGLFCPACYDTEGKKHLTTRLNPRFRQCTVCKALIGRG